MVQRLGQTARQFANDLDAMTAQLGSVVGQWFSWHLKAHARVLDRSDQMEPVHFRKQGRERDP